MSFVLLLIMLVLRVVKKIGDFFCPIRTDCGYKMWEYTRDDEIRIYYISMWCSITILPRGQQWCKHWYHIMPMQREQRRVTNIQYGLIPVLLISPWWGEQLANRHLPSWSAAYDKKSLLLSKQWRQFQPSSARQSWRWTQEEPFLRCLGYLLWSTILPGSDVRTIRPQARKSQKECNLMKFIWPYNVKLLVY